MNFYENELKDFKLIFSSSVEHLVNTYIKCKHNGKQSTLHFASEQGMYAVCEKLLTAESVGIDCRDVFNRTPLMLACESGHVEIVKLLLQEGADPNLTDCYGNSPLMFSIVNGNFILFQTIYSCTKNFICNTILGKITPLAVAALFGKMDIMKFLLNKLPQHLDEQVELSGMTPLMLATLGGHTDIINLLITKGASKILKNSMSSSALDIAHDLKYDDIKKLLIGRNLPLLYTSSPSSRPQFLDFFHSTPTKNSSSPKMSYPLTPNVITPQSPKSKSKGLFFLKTMKRMIRINCEDNVDCGMDFRLTASRMSQQSTGAYQIPIKTQSPPQSKSVERETKLKKKGNDGTNDIFESILNFSKLSDLQPLFKEQEIDLKTFLTMEDEDLISIGIKKASTRSKILKIIQHYKRIFYL